METTSGETHFQQGLAATCKELPDIRVEARSPEEDLGLSHESIGAKKDG
jgi:hypothetical protein